MKYSFIAASVSELSRYFNNRWIISFVLYWTLATKTDGFNIGTSEAVSISGTKGTNFGATVNFLPQKSTYRTSEEPTLLVSATNLLTENESGEPQLGVMYVCNDVFGSTPNCTYFHNDDQKILPRASKTEHYGSSVALDEEGFQVVCSPQWMDTSPESINFQFLPGRCSIKDPNYSGITESRPYYNSESNWGNYVMNVEGHSLYYEGTALYGFSVDINKGDFFIVGAPGVLSGEGSVVYTDFQSMSSRKMPVVMENNYETTADGYLGYAVKIGTFCESEAICFAASAPNLNRKGMVKIFKLTKGRISDGFHLVQQIEGEQAWSYFGYSMAVCDINNDGLDELLVGAPQFADTNDLTSGFDQGKVYVYSKTRTSQDLELQVTLEGSRSKFARFGSAIHCIGDVNLDGFTDIAVGAPEEDEGAGAIYIYLGSKTGLLKEISQKISPKQIDCCNSMKGLGYAISGPENVKGSNRPVFAVSSIRDDIVIVFKSRPVVVPTVTFTAEPNPVDLDDTCSSPNTQVACFTVTLCLAGSTRDGSSWDHEFFVKLEIDTKVSSDIWKRALFKRNNRLSSSIPETLVNTQTSPCTSYLAVTIENQINKDRFSPLNIDAHVRLASVADGNSSPVLDVLSPTTYQTTVTFKNACGDNNKCEVDLVVSGMLRYSEHDDNWKSIVIDETKELLVDLTISNKKETAYWTVVEISLDSPLPFSRLLGSTESSIVCQPIMQDSKDKTDSQEQSKVVCNYYTPLEEGESVKIGVAFDTYDMPQDKDTVKVKVQARPNNEASEEVNQNDNSWVAITDVRIIADVTVDGVSTPPEVTVQQAKRISLTTKADINDEITIPDHDIHKLGITHKILVQNNGPSRLLPTSLTVSVPYVLQDASLLVHSGQVQLTTSLGVVSVCKPLKEFGKGTGRTKEGGDTDLEIPTIVTLDPDININPGGSVTIAPGGGGEGEGKVTEPPTTVPTTTDNRGGLPDPPINRRRRSTKVRAVDDIEAGNVLSNIYVQSCKMDPQYCQVFQCTIADGLARNDHVELNVSLTIDRANIPIPQDFNTYYYTILTEVAQPNHPLFLPWSRGRRSSQTLTKFHLVTTDDSINIWGLIGGVIGGLLVVTLCVIILWKCGFFKRNKHHQVAQWKRESQRRSQHSSAPKSDGDGKQT